MKYLALILAIACMPPATLLSATYTVTNGNDSGAGSFRQAILDANATANHDIISFSAALANTSISLQSTLTIEEALVIQGPPGGLVTLDGSAGGFTIMKTSVRASDPATAVIVLDGLTFANGSHPTASGLLIHAGHNLQITRCQFVDNTNQASSGAGLVMRGHSLTISDSAFINNRALLTTTAAVPSGGAMAVTSGRCSLIRCQFQGDQSDWDGGAIMTATGMVQLAITDCSFIGNSASKDGGALAIHAVTDAITIVGSTFGSNSAGEAGGAIARLGNHPPIDSILDSTFSQNSAGIDGGAIAYLQDETSIIRRSTFYGNQADTDSEDLHNGDGGALWVSPTTTAPPTIGHCIFVGNVDQSVTQKHHDVSGLINSTGYNIIAHRVGSSGFNTVTDKDYLELRIGSAEQVLDIRLQDNGGPTMTHMPIFGGPAHNTGAPLVSGLDQRDLARTKGNAADRGSVEIQHLPYDEWIAEHSISSKSDFQADYDGDGTLNGAEWMQDTDPTVQNTPQQITTVGSVTDLVALQFTAGIDFPLDKCVVELAIHPSSNALWEAVPNLSFARTQFLPSGHQLIQTTVSVGTLSRLFLRLTTLEN